MSIAAAGNRALVGLAREQSFGVADPAATVEYLRPILPLDVGLARTESAGGEVNQSGFWEAGVPGPIGGPMNLAARFSAATMLTYLEHILGKVTKSTLTTGVYQYLFEPETPGKATSLWGIWGLPPVDQGLLYGIKFSQLALAIGNNTAIPARLTGTASHGTPVGLATPGGSNTGTYTMGPVLRGLPKSTTGKIYVKVTRVSTGLQFKVEQTAGVPSYAGSAVDVVLDPTTLSGVFQNLQGSTGLDLGYYAENKDPLEICWPGTAADHADLAVNDVFEFDPTWDLPTGITYIGGQRFTSAHWLNQVRALGGSTWTDFRTLTGNLTVGWPVSVDQGSGSRYAYGLDRDGIFTPTMQLVRKLTDRSFLGYLEEHERFEMKTSFLGAQLTAAYRESVVFDWSNVAVTTQNAPVQNANAIQETVTLRGETSDSGDLPLTVTVITDRDWTPAT